MKMFKVAVSIVIFVLIFLSCPTSPVHAAVIKLTDENEISSAYGASTPIMIMEYLPSVYARAEIVVWDAAEQKNVSFVDGHGGSRSELKQNQIYAPALTIISRFVEQNELTVTVKDERSSWQEEQKVVAGPGDRFCFISDDCTGVTETGSNGPILHIFRYAINGEELPVRKTFVIYEKTPESELGLDRELSDFLILTKLDKLMLELKDGAEIEKVSYDNGLYTPYPDQGKMTFTTGDPSEIAALWEAVQKIEIREPGVFLTD